MMKITFYKRTLNSYDQPYDSTLMSFVYPSTISEERAIEEAKKAFQKECKCDNWQEIADFYRRE